MRGNGLDELLRELSAIVGRERLVAHPDALRAYQSDGLTRHRAMPVAVVLPDDSAEVQKVVRALHGRRVPWVARGAGSGLSGGALPVADGVVIALTRLRRVLDVDLENSRVTVQPGVTNAQVSAAVAPTHFYPPDPSSQVVCTIGGNVAENAGGAHCFKYGFTTNYVCGVELVLADGERVDLGGTEIDRPGLDLVGAIVGSEGTLGVVTRITLRVIPVPEAQRTLIAFFADTGSAGEVVSELVGGSGVVPAAIEMMDELALQAVEQAVNPGFPHAGAALLVELDGPEAECAPHLDHVVEVCQRHGAEEVRVARDAAERDRLWRARKAAFAAMGRVSPSYYVQDGVVPRTRLAEVLRRIDELAAEHGLRVANVFHAGDGNLHPLVCYDHAKPGEPERAELLAAEILSACIEAGGSITGEHGVGIDKKAQMPAMFADADLEAFQRLRCAFDPDGLANPGKVMPTPRLCGEVPGPYRRHPLELAGVAERL
ncbi:MAG: FAD-linked oxidase C-terminal domain-containing protein [Solirubrobacteraceae bacterium]|nr:MAG: FAD-binding oxidoreductase [Solirubrobacterales bacterium]